MSIQDIATSTQLTDDEYLPIWTALMETARGRSFLREFARRTRSAETRTLLDAVQKLEHALLDARQEATPSPAASHAPAATGAAAGSRGGETARLQAAIAQAVPALEYAARIGARARADLQASVDDIQAAANTLRPLIDGQLDDHAAANARHACDSIDARVLDMDEIIAVQQLGDEQAINATATLAELVTAQPPAGAAMSGEPARRPAPRAAAPQTSTVQAAPVTAGAGRVSADLASSGLASAGIASAGRAGAEHAGVSRAHPATPAAPRPVAARPQPVAHAASATGQGHGENPAIQKLIQEITARLLNDQDIAPSTPGRARR
ncbi:hypothetical protein ACERNI_00520 [Camelimonas sp. ID_303_24]